ncbi:MAG: DUF4423 domain-containing protein [Pseudomonadota bacterium]
MVASKNKELTSVSGEPTLSFEQVAGELIRSLRGRQSQAAFSRRIGYRSNIVSRWEAQQAFPTASRFLEVFAKVRPRETAPLRRFFPRLPVGLAQLELSSRQAVAAFLTELKGRTPILSVARESGFNRYSVSHWLSGDTEPRLPQFLCLVEVLSRRLLDFLACCTDPQRMSSVSAAWKRLGLMREAAYTMPWSHAVLRALELEQSAEPQLAWLLDRLGISEQVLTEALSVLERTGQVTKVRGRWSPTRIMSVNTAQDRTRAHALKVSWTQTALERMRANAPGNYGYSIFSISKADLTRMRDVHLEYVRAMQQIIAESTAGQCVGLYCAQLLDLGLSHNALSD